MFTVKDLKPGMLVKLYSGRVGILVPCGYGKLFVVGMLTDEKYISKLCEPEICASGLSGISLDYSIVAVYGYYEGCTYDFFDIEGRKLLWEYKEPEQVKEVTLSELKELFGCDIKIVQEDN